MLDIVIDFDAVSVHQVRNFGEILFDAFKSGKAASISLAQVDRATDQLRIVVQYPSKQRVRQTLRTVERLVEEHLLSGRARVSQVEKPS